MRKWFPILPTLLVGVSIAIMISLGLWQIDRKAEKEALIARYETAIKASERIAWPKTIEEAEANLYRRSDLVCEKVDGVSSMAGRNAQGDTGMGHVATCRLADGRFVAVVLGWSNNPTSPAWAGGAVSGIIAPGGEAGPRLIAEPPLAGLAANAKPDPSEISNNHLSYAGQWFFFAFIALVIYVLALRSRLRAS